MEGILPQIGTTGEIFHRPATRSVARFVQVENILDGSVVENLGGEAAVEVSGRIFRAVSPAEPGMRVSILFRAEDVTIGLDGSALTSARNLFPGRVKRLIPAGPFMRAVIDCGVDVTALVTLRSAGDLGLSPGKDVWISVKATAIHLLPERE